MKKIAAGALLAAPVLAALFAPLAFADDCKFGADRSARVDGTGIRKVVIGAGAGDLDIRGEEGRTDVLATGRACAPSQKQLDEIRIESRREGDTLYLKTILPEPVERLFMWNRDAYMDVTVSVPKSAVLVVEDSSGDLELSNVQSATVADSSGDQTIRNIAGDLDVTDSSGEIGIEHVIGNLRLKDSSGDIDIDDVKGSVEITVDSSGDMTIQRVAGDVHVINDSSGDIEIADVQRNVSIDSDSSGSIRVDRIGGDFTVGADGSGDISHDRVLGSVHLPENN